MSVSSGIKSFLPLGGHYLSSNPSTQNTLTHTHMHRDFLRSMISHLMVFAEGVLAVLFPCMVKVYYTCTYITSILPSSLIGLSLATGEDTPKDLKATRQ